MTQFLLLLIAILLLGGTVFLVFGRWSKLDALGIYTIIVGLYFGLYTIVDVLLNGVDGVAMESAVLVIVSVVISTAIIWSMYFLMPGEFREILLLRNLTAHWMIADSRGVMVAASLAVIFQVYAFVTFGVVTHVYVGDLEKMGIDIPSWIAPARELANSVAFGALLFYFAKLSGRSTLGWANGFLLVAIIIIFGLLGRRALLNIGMIGLFILFLGKKRMIGSVKGFVLISLVVTVLVFFSNIYQTYRNELSYQATSGQSESLSLTEAAINFEATLDNLGDRLAMWRFNDMIVSKQLDDPLNVLGGQLTWQAFKNSIPGAVWQRKDVVDIDEMVATFYGFEVTDYPASNFSTLQADYGFVMVLLTPALCMGVMFMIVIARKTLLKRPFLLLMISGFALQYLMNLESSLGDTFILFRNIALIVCAYVGFEILSVFWRFIIYPVPARSRAGSISEVTRK